MTRQKKSVRRRGIIASAVTGIVALALTGCGLQPAASFVPNAQPGTIRRISGLPSDARITVTSKNFTEQIILGKMAVLALRAAGFKATDETNVPGSVAVRQLMTTHAADLTYDYTGTAWLTYMGHAKASTNQNTLYKQVRAADKKNGLTWLKPAPMNDTYALAVRGSAVKKLGNITSLSQIKTLPVSERTFCVESEFYSRSDGFKPMLKKYGLEFGSSAANGVPSKNVSLLDTGTVYAATAAGKCNFGEVYTTDGRIASLGLKVLQDDEHFFPAYNASPVFSTATLKKYPELKQIFNRISPSLTNAVMRNLNRKVDVDGDDPGTVAYNWMVKKGFVQRK